jgi:uncharacterized protein (DUF362 family)
MSTYSRRDFLVHSVATTGMLALGARSLTAQAAPAKAADMTIARWAGQQQPSAAEMQQLAVKLTEKAIEGLGGMGRFVKRGDVVWVKPNIGWDRTPEQAANSNPDLIATLVKMCLNAGAKTVKIGDNPVDKADKTYQSSGIAAAVRDLGAKVVVLDSSRFKEAAIKGEKLKTAPVYPEILDCDLVINAAIVKHHVRSEATLCMKNYMGVVDNRKVFHQDIAAYVADITRFMRPRLCVLDAIRILKAHGPKGGDLADVQVKNIVAAGVDIVALDALGAEIMGLSNLPSVIAGEKAGLGKANYKAIAKELAVS